MKPQEQNSAQVLVESLLSSSADFYRRGWMWGTSGNLSAKIASSPLTIAITGSGASKGELTAADISIVPDDAVAKLDWAVVCRATPSAETVIHRTVYETIPQAVLVYHVHTVASTALSLAVVAQSRGPSYLEVQDVEMLKGWGVAWSGPSLSARIPILPNRESMQVLADDLRRRLAGGVTVPVVLVAGHGMTVWGRTPAETRSRLEVAEFICQVLWQQRLGRR